MDKKGNYYTSPDNYTDIDGNLKTFTYIDHDKKTSISMSTETEEEREERKKNHKTLLQQTIDEIIEFPAIYAAYPEDDMLKAHLFNEIINSEDGVKWDIPILKEICMIDRDFALLLRSRLWKQYIKPENIFKELTHEEFMEGKWKELI